MICARCMSQIGAGNEGCPACGERPELLGRYRLDRELELAAGAGRAFRATRLEDAMLVRVCMVELPAAMPSSSATMGLDKLRHSKLARVLEVSPEPDHGRLWILHERVGGSSLAEIARVEDRRLRDPRWVGSVAHQMTELLAFAHAQQPPLVGLALGLDAFVIRNGVGGVQRRGPPRVSLIELRPAERPAGQAASDREDLRQLGLGLRAMLGGDEHDSSWREHPGLDTKLLALIDAMIDIEGAPEHSAAEMRRSIAGLADELRNTHAKARGHTSGRPRPVASRMGASAPPPLSRESVQGPRPTPRDDVPVMRPADLSRELSQAYRATAAVEDRQRKAQLAARLTLVLLVAIITALTTYIVFV